MTRRNFSESNISGSEDHQYLYSTVTSTVKLKISRNPADRFGFWYFSNKLQLKARRMVGSRGSGEDFFSVPGQESFFHEERKMTFMKTFLEDKKFKGTEARVI